MNKIYAYHSLALTLIILQARAAEQQPSQLDAQTMQHYFLANYSYYAHDHQKAVEIYEVILATPNPPLHAYKGYLNLLYQTNQLSTILQLMPKLKTAFKDDVTMQLLFRNTLERAGRVAEADTITLDLVKQFKTNAEVAYHAASTYIRTKELENALAVIDDFLNNTPRKSTNYLFHFLKSQIYVSLNKSHEAYESVKKAIELQPHFDKGWLLYAILEEQRGILAEAVKGYTNYLAHTEGAPRSVEQHLLELVFKQKMLKQKDDAALTSLTTLEKAMALFEKKQFDNALAHLEAYLTQQPKNQQARLLKIEILVAKKEHAKAATLIKSWLIEDPQPLWFKTLHLLCYSGLTHQKAIALLEDIEAHYPKLILPSLYLADLHMRLENHNAALMHHKKALAAATDPMLKTKILYQMGTVYYEQRNTDALLATLEEGYALRMDYAPLLNLLAYHYATHEKNLEKAQALLAIALQKDSANPHYLDTQAVVFYKQGKYAESMTLLQKITKEVPNDAVILQHLGKVQYKLGNTAQAQATVQQALTCAHNESEKTACTNLLKRWDPTVQVAQAEATQIP